MSGTKGKGGLFTEADYKIIKKLQENGLSTAEVGKLTGRNATTICQVAKTDTFKEYKDVGRSRYTRPAGKSLIEPIEAPKESFNEIPNNDSKVVAILAELVQAVNRLTDVLEQDTPLQSEAKQYKLFRRK